MKNEKSRETGNIR